MNTSSDRSGLVILWVPGPACGRATLSKGRRLPSASLPIVIVRNYSSASNAPNAPNVFTVLRGEGIQSSYRYSKRLEQGLGVLRVAPPTNTRGSGEFRHQDRARASRVRYRKNRNN